MLRNNADAHISSLGYLWHEAITCFLSFPSNLETVRGCRGCLHEKTRTGASFIPLGMTFWFCIAFIWWLGHFISRYLKVHFILVKYTCDSKSQTLPTYYPFQSTGRPISHWNAWSFHVYMILLWDFEPEWISRPSTTTGVNSRRGDSRRYDISWRYQM